LVSLGANYDANTAKLAGINSVRTVPVDSFEPNPWGLYNVHGNVWEWTEDYWNDRNTSNPGDGRARMTGDCARRAVRGGSWFYYPQRLRSASRLWRYVVRSIKPPCRVASDPRPIWGLAGAFTSAIRAPLPADELQARLRI